MGKNSEWRKNNPEKFREQLRRRRERHKERFAEYKKEWWKKNPPDKEHIREKNWKWREANREYYNSYQREYKFKSGKGAEYARNARLRNPEKYLARQAVRNAVRSGILIKTDFCQDCGKKAKVTAHHFLGYDKSHWLDVQWICRECHHKKHDCQINREA